MVVDGLGQKLDRAGLEGATAGIDVPVACDDDDRPPAPSGVQCFLKLEPRYVRHADISNYATSLQSRLMRKE